MKMTEEIQQAGLPSLLQIQYLMELEKIGWKRGAVMEIAEKCGVSHPAVSRYLKSCCEKGILNEKYEFTVSGKMMLERYRKLLGETEKYLTRIGIAQEEQKETLRKLIENLDCATLGRIVRSDRTPIQHTKGPLIWKEETFLDDMLEWGSWLERSIRTMNAMSRVDHAEMEGKLSSLKYECNGRLHKAEIRGNKVNIPLEACRFAQNSRGIIKGRVMTTRARSWFQTGVQPHGPDRLLPEKIRISRTNRITQISREFLQMAPIPLTDVSGMQQRIRHS